MQTLEIGQLAPEFRLKGPGGAFVSLSDYIGYRNVVLVFFPLAFSPTCSHQLPEIQRLLDRFRELDTEVFGVSADSHYANEAFARALGLEFPLLSDFKREAMAAYGVLNARAGYSGRAVFAIDKQGRLVHRDVSANPGDLSQIPSPERVLEALRAAGT
jgi:peroxiredoxin (alkyl hydroperoxide reductase subunit C)